MTPAPGSVLRAPGIVLHLDAAGTVRTVSSAADPALAWLAGCGELDVTTADGPLAPGVPRVAVDRDEVEVERFGGGLRTVVRHAVEQGWTVRVVLANESDTALELAQVRLGWTAAPGTVVTALAGGASAAYAVQPAAGDGPVLVGRLRSGVQAGVDETGLLLGPLVLAPHHRWAAQWRWQVVPDVRRAGTGGLPPTTWLDRDRAVVLPAGPDVAVVAPGLAVEVDDDRVEVAAWEPGAHEVELRSARGTTTLPLTWAPDLDDLVDTVATELLAGATTPAGTPRLAGAAAGLVVQDALVRRATGAPDELVDALELVAGRLVEELDEGSGPVDPLTLAFLTREADRTGASSLLDAAGRRFLGTPAAIPGLGLAGVGLALARVRQGRPSPEVVAHLGELLAGAPSGDAAGLELALLLRARDAVADEPVLAALRRLGARLGAGLPGRVVPPVELAGTAYASTVLGLVDEPTGHRLADVWGVPAAEVARRTAAEARARLWSGEGGGAARRALAWLVLGRP